MYIKLLKNPKEDKTMANDVNVSAQVTEPIKPDIKVIQRPTITSNGVDTAGLIDKSAYRGIQYNKTKKKEEAEQDAKNYVLNLQFPIITCDKNGNLTSEYTDNGETKTAHGYTTASVSANMATMSNIEAVMADQVRKDGKDPFAGDRSKEGKNGVPIATKTVTLGGKTTFEIDAVALASVSAKERNAANAGKNVSKYDEGNRARLNLTLSQTKATVDGVANVTADSLKSGLTSTAVTSYIASNSTAHNEGRNRFNDKVITAAGDLLAKSYDTAVAEVAEALAKGEALASMKSTKDSSELAGTKLGKGLSVKLINVDGVKAFVQEPGADAAKVKNDMKAVASVVEARANAHRAQMAFSEKTLSLSDENLGGTAYNLVTATKFSVPAIGLKQTDDKGNTKSAGFVVLSPSTAATLTPTGANATRLNAAVKAETEAKTRAIVGEAIFDEAESMAKDVLGEQKQATREEARDKQNAVIDKVREAVNAAGKSYDSISYDADGKNNIEKDAAENNGPTK
jgi:hypothetical protein